MNIKNFFQSKISRKILCAIGALIVVLLIFQAGMFVGYRKAAFSFRWGDNYYRAFGGHRGERMMDFPRADFLNAHGTIGKIIKINLPVLVIETQDKVEKIVLVGDNTVIRRFRETVKPSDLKIDDSVVIIGSPDDKSQIEAKLIRLIPSPVATATGTSTPPAR